MIFSSTFKIAEQHVLNTLEMKNVVDLFVAVVSQKQTLLFG
jgi:hypothetical protein